MAGSTITGWGIHRLIAGLNAGANASVAVAPAEPGPTCDGVICGSLDQPITGIVVCWMLTRANMDRVAQGDANMVITHEPTFYTQHDLVRERAETAVPGSKHAALQQLGWLVYRVHDCWDLYPRFGVADRLAAAIGLGGRVAERDGVCLYELAEPVSVDGLAQRAKRELGLEHVRVAGPDRVVRRVAVGVGAWGGWSHLLSAIQAEADVFLTGETCEWQTVRFAEDAGLPMIVVGHSESEEPGIEGLAEWLGARVPVPVRYVRTGPCYRYP
jgi:putative NIF3 family GTP cyclohydrolase 1 type 2